MKKSSVILSGVFLLSLFGCEISSNSDGPSDLMAKKVNLLNSMDTEGNLNQMPIELKPLDNTKEISARKYEDGVTVRGHMDWYPVDSESTWKISVNATGNATAGNGQFEMKSTFWGDFHGSVLCTYAEDNVAVYAIYITDLKTPSFVFEEGKIVLFKLIDNGEGANSPADQHYNTAFYTPEEFETIEDAQEYLANNHNCESLFGFYWGFASDIQEGNFQVQ